MVISSVVQDDDNGPGGPGGYHPHALQEPEAGLPVEPDRLPQIHELAVKEADGPVVADVLPQGVVEDHGLLGFGRDPHPAPRAVQLEQYLVDGPQFHGRVSHHRGEFF